MEPYQYRVSLRAPQKVSAGEKETAFPGLSHARVGGVCVYVYTVVRACMWARACGEPGRRMGVANTKAARLLVTACPNQ